MQCIGNFKRIVLATIVTFIVIIALVTHTFEKDNAFTVKIKPKQIMEDGTNTTVTLATPTFEKENVSTAKIGKKQSIEDGANNKIKPHQGSTETGSEKCLPKHNIFFNKVHKCGSSTLASIFMRYAYFNSLSIVMTRPGEFKMSGNILKAMDETVRTPNDKYNIFCFHWYFNRSEAEQIMNRDTVYLTSIREPVARFVSSYKFGYKEGRTKPLNLHIQRNAQSGDKIVMLRDIGFPSPEENVTDYIKKLDSWFHLVMIVEYWYESLILMKELLCWKTQDVVHMSFHVTHSERTHKQKLSNESYTILWRRLEKDRMLYQHFVKKLEEKIEAFGKERMEKEVRELKSVMNDWEKKCSSSKGETNSFCKLSKYFYETKRELRRKQFRLIKEGYTFPS